MTVLAFPLVAAATAATVLVFAFGVRRLIGRRLPLPRTLAAAPLPTAAGLSAR